MFDQELGQGNTIPDKPSLPQNTVAASLKAYSRALAQFGDVEIKLSNKPMIINGKPAVALIIGDVHTEEGEKRTREILNFIKAKYNPQVIFLEGLISDPRRKKEINDNVDQYEQSVKAAVQIMTEAERQEAGLNFVNPDLHKNVDYRNVGFKNEQGMENPAEQVKLARAIALLNGTENWLSHFQGKTFALLTVGDKFVNEHAANLYFAVQSIHKEQQYSFPINTDLKKGTYNIDNKEFPVSYLDVESISRFYAAVLYYYEKEFVDKRNRYAAEVTEQTIRRIKSNPTVTTYGQLHLRDGLNSSSYPSALADKGISSVTVFPYAK